MIVVNSEAEEGTNPAGDERKLEELQQLSASIMYNATTCLPDLYLSRHLNKMELKMTAEEHPLENKTMYLLHECNFSKALPIGEDF